jgi:hypothetical protein
VTDDAPETVIVRGRERARVRLGEERAPGDSPCPGCRAYYFELHAVGCEYEECPACGGALAICGCATDR